MKTICWIQHASEWQLFTLIAEALKRDGYDSVFICTTREAHHAYAARGLQSIYVGSTLSDTTPVPPEEIERVDVSYGPPGIKEMGDSDVHLTHLFGKRQSQKEEAITRMYHFWENFLKENTIDFFIARETATFAARTAYALARRRRVPFYQIAPGPGDDTFTLDGVNENHVWQRLLDVLGEKPRELSSEERSRVESFIEERIASVQEKMQLRFVPVSLLSALKNILGMTARDTARVRADDPVKVAAWRYGKTRIWEKLRWKYVTRPLFRYDCIQENEPYVYFPIYSGLETSYLSNDHFFAKNEVALIKEMALCLPAGTWLYVKEHPRNPGDLSFSELRELQSIPNVRVLFPSVSSVDLVRGAAAVFVLEGTTGWEAFLLRRPVICLGNTFFSLSKLVYKVGDISELAHIVRKALSVGAKIYEERSVEWQWFIYSVISTSLKGVTVRLGPPYGFPTDSANAAMIAQSIRATLEDGSR